MRRHFQKLLAFSVALASPAFAQTPDAGKGDPTKGSVKRPVAVVYSFDGVAMQPSIDFYRAIFQNIAQNSSWEPLPMASIRRAMPGGAEQNRIGGIPYVDRDSFRSHLPKRLRKKNDVKLVPGTSVPELQRLLDNLRAPAAIVVDCARKSPTLLKACGLYYYDRVNSKVIASSVKAFLAGANDGSVWAAPMITNLENGLMSAQREKDQAVIEELVARNEDDDKKEWDTLVAIFGRGDRARLSSDWEQTISGLGLQVGFLKDSVGAYAEISQLSWSGNSNDVGEASRLSYGLSMIFRAKALDYLLWYFELGGGREISKFKAASNDDDLAVDGLYTHIFPGLGVQLGQNFSLNLGIGWRWFFERSTSQSTAFKDVAMEDAHGPSLLLRGMVLF